MLSGPPICADFECFMLEIVVQHIFDRSNWTCFLTRRCGLESASRWNISDNPRKRFYQSDARSCFGLPTRNNLDFPAWFFTRSAERNLRLTLRNLWGLEVKLFRHRSHLRDTESDFLGLSDIGRRTRYDPRKNFCFSPEIFQDVSKRNCLSNYNAQSDTKTIVLDLM